MSGGSLTLAFEVGAMRRLADPEAAVADAREWSAYVGVISDDPGVATHYARQHGFQQDFFAEQLDLRASLSFIRQEYHTDRHVFVGTDQRHRSLADASGWEYRPIDEAAEKAGWELEPEEEEPGTLDRLYRWLHRVGDGSG